LSIQQETRQWSELIRAERAHGKVVKLRAVHASLSRESDWQVGDVLLIDNVAVAHGRRPFTGDRRILVAMSD
jgi:alpha-ketoglutarate-dependent taurine dioxygenase